MNKQFGSSSADGYTWIKAFKVLILSIADFLGCLKNVIISSSDPESYSESVIFSGYLQIIDLIISSSLNFTQSLKSLFTDAYSENL